MKAFTFTAGSLEKECTLLCGVVVCKGQLVGEQGGSFEGNGEETSYHKITQKA